MLKFLDGPAQGILLQARTAPLLLRVVNRNDPPYEWDCLDYPKDTAEEGETIHVYVRTGTFSSVHVKLNNKSVWLARADYRHYSIPDTIREMLRDNDQWRDFVLKQE